MAQQNSTDDPNQFCFWLLWGFATPARCESVTAPARADTVREMEAARLGITQRPGTS
jgi:hypothetical protein